MKERDDNEQKNPRKIQAPIYPFSGNSRNENSMNPNSPNGSNMPFHSRPVPFLGSGAIIQPTLRHSSPPGLTPIRPQNNLPPHQPWLPTSQYPRISPERPPSQIARPWTQSQMTIVQGTNQMPLQPGHMIRMPDGKLGKVIKTGQNLNQGSPNSLRNLSHNSPPRATQVQKQKTQKPAFRLHQFDFLATANQNQKKDTQNLPKKRKSEKSEKEKGKMNLPHFKRKKKPPKEEKIRPKQNSNQVQNPAPAPVQKQKPQKAILIEEKPKEIKVRPIPNMEKIVKELLKQNKPRVDEWGPLEIVKQRKFQWPALPEGVEIVWNNSFYQPFNLTKIAVDELEKTLRESVSRDIFDVRRYIEKIIQNSNNFTADPDDEQFQQQFSFQKASKIKIWRCPNSAFIFEDDSHTLRVTVAMCRSVNEWSTKKGKLTENERKTQEKGQKPSEKGPKEVVKDQIELKKEPQALETGQKMQKIGEKTEEAQEIKEEASFFEESSTLSTLTDDEVPTSPLGSEPNSNAGEEPEKKRAKISKADAKEKLSTIGEIQDSPCMRYLTRQYANKKKDTFIRRGIGENYVCGVCDKLYWKDFHNFQKSHCNERSLYYDGNGEFDASPDLTRNISCAFQGLRRLCPGKAVTAQTSIEQILREKRGLKPSSFTNSKIIPEWYHRLFLPSDEFREVMISPQTARHLLEILWGDIREMLLEEIEWEKSSNKDYLDGTFKQLRMRYGKNTVKRVIPGVRETCDRCKTSLFNSHYICTSCGGTICPKCAMKKIPGTDLKKIHHCSFCHNHRTIPDDRNTVLPISFIPIESFKNIYVLLQFIMSSNPSHDVPDVCHPLSTERYLKDKNVIPQELDLVGDINKSQLEELLKLEQRKIDEKMKTDLLKDIEKILVDPLSDFESSDSDNDPAISPSGDELSPSDLDKINKIEQRIDSSGKVHSRFKAKVEIIDTKHFRDTPNSVIHLDGKKSKSALDTEIYAHWENREPIVIFDLDKHPSFDHQIWSVDYFEENYSQERAILVDCRENEHLSKGALREFWAGFSNYNHRYTKSMEDPPIYKLKDWPTTDDICRKMPLHFKAFKEFLPCHEICHRDGALNLAKYLPKYFCIPDLGPKMYIAYGWLEEFIDKNKHEVFLKMKQGSTDCHIDISGAINVMTNVVEPVNSFSKRQRREALRNLLVEGGLSDEEIDNFIESGRKPGALWHIWPVRDTEKIRKLLHERDEEQYKKGSGNDAIHDQDTYITSEIREMLEKHGVKGKYILQCEGDAVFIPSGAIHQVLNINSCIKIACDFISPQCVRRSLLTTEELRHLSTSHQNREDKLQLKAHLFHTAKEILSSLLWEPIFKQKLHQKPVI